MLGAVLAHVFFFAEQSDIHSLRAVRPTRTKSTFLTTELYEASQRTHREHSPNEVLGKVPVRSCRECHQKTADHLFVDKQWSRVPS